MAAVRLSIADEIVALNVALKAGTITQAQLDKAMEAITRGDPRANAADNDWREHLKGVENRRRHRYMAQWEVVKDQRASCNALSKDAVRATFGHMAKNRADGATAEDNGGHGGQGKGNEKAKWESEPGPIRQSSPERHRHSSREGRRHSSPERRRHSNPENHKHSSPENQRHSSPEKHRQTNPEGQIRGQTRGPAESAETTTERRAGGEMGDTARRIQISDARVSEGARSPFAPVECAPPLRSEAFLREAAAKGWAPTTAATYWNAFRRAAAVVGEEVADGKKMGHHLQHQAEIHSAGLERDALDAAAVRDAKVMLKGGPPYAALVAAFWLGQRIGDVLLLRRKNVQHIGGRMVLTFQRGKVVPHIGAYTLHLPRSDPPR